MDSVKNAQAYVTKSFLIDIITRDIGILEAILELVDNSVDRAVELYNIEVTKGLTEDYTYDKEITLHEPLSVKIDLSDNQITIEDNCGGISNDDLKEEVFIFGNPKKDTDYLGLSAFGIGMKRALFKLGRMVEIRTRTKEDESAINWDINVWVESGNEKGDWDIPFADVKDSELKYSYELPGTVIKVTGLNNTIQKRFMQPEFLVSLKNRLQTSYALFLKSGLKIFLNGEQLNHSLPGFVTSDEFSYTSKSLKVDDVDIQIILGITPVSDRIPRGWYIFCNGRMVIESDKTFTTGWGTYIPSFHPKWNHFLGFVSFKSSNVKALPWSSTKWGIELDSYIYNIALEEMKLQAKPILNFLDRWKDGIDDDAPAPHLYELLKNGKETPVFASAGSEKFFTYKPKKPIPEVTRITFTKDRALVERVKEALGNPSMKNVSVGELVFDYYVEREID